MQSQLLCCMAAVQARLLSSAAGYVRDMSYLHVQVIVQAVLDMPALAIITWSPVPVLPQHMSPNLRNRQLGLISLSAQRGSGSLGLLVP